MTFENLPKIVKRVVAGMRERSEALAACEGVTWSNQTSGRCISA